MAAIWDFLSERFELFLIYKSPRCFTPSFESIGPLVQEKKRKKEFQDGLSTSHPNDSVQEKKRKIDFQDGCHLGFPIRTILAIFDLQVIPMLLINFRVYLPFGSGKEAKKKKKEFEDGSHGSDFGFPTGMILAIFHLQVTTKFRVNWPFLDFQSERF